MFYIYKMSADIRTLFGMADEVLNKGESEGRETETHEDGNKSDEKIIERGEKLTKDKEEMYDGHEMNITERIILFEPNCNGSNPHNSTGEHEQNKHVTYDELVQVYHVNSYDDKRVVFSKPLSDSNTKACSGPNISDPNLKKKVTFSKEIIVIACDQDDVDQSLDYDGNDQDTEENHNQAAVCRDDTSFRNVFGICQDAKHDEMTVNYAETIVNRNVFKTVSFSNEVSIIQDGNLTFTTTIQDSFNDGFEQLSKIPISRVDKLLTKLKKVVKKLEDKSKYGKSANRDKKVLGDAEQDRSFHQVDVMKVENTSEKQVAFSDQIEFIQMENRTLEQREPNLRKVTFSKEIIVIAYPHDDEDMLDASRYSTELLDKSNDDEIEQSSVNYTNRNVCKTVSFSNEVTIIHDANLVFRSESNESVKDNVCAI